MLTDAASPNIGVGTESTKNLKIFENLQEKWEGGIGEESVTFIQYFNVPMGNPKIAAEDGRYRRLISTALLHKCQ